MIIKQHKKLTWGFIFSHNIIMKGRFNNNIMITFLVSVHALFYYCINYPGFGAQCTPLSQDIVFYPLKPDSDWIQTFLWNLCWVELPNSVCGFKPTTRKNNSWVQTQKHQIVNSGFGLIFYWEQSEKKLILKSV